MKFSKTLINTAILGFFLASFHYTAWADTPEQQFQQGVEATDRGDYQTAFKLWLPLAEQGYDKAQFFLGIMYQSGRGVKQDTVEAVKWYRKAAEQGYAKAQFNLGVMYYNGEGVKRNPSKAKEWFRKACDNGHQNACDALRKLEK